MSKIIAPLEDVTMEEVDMLYESNLIELERSEMALEDAIEAWKYAVADKENITVQYILNIHHLLMCRLAPNIAGRFRDCDVWIGGERKKFITESVLKEQLEEWIKDLKAASNPLVLSDAEKEGLAQKLHIDYENFHGFSDGNGRSGRILYQIHRLLLGLPIVVIESKTKYEKYYPWFKK